MPPSRKGTCSLNFYSRRFLGEDEILKIQKILNHLPSVQSLESDYDWCGDKGVLGESVRNFTEITHLSISFVKTKTYFPNMLLRFSDLHALYLKKCSKLQKLPPNLGHLKGLTSLLLCYCPSIKSLPDSLITLSKLTTLDISHCDNLEELPTNLGDFESLMDLSLEDCHSFKSLPRSVAKLRKLTTIMITYCKKFQDLPANLGELKSLSLLSIDDCESLRECPSNLNAVDLYLERCCSIQSLPRGLSNLNYLLLSLCISREEKRLANLKYFVSLRYLQFSICSLHKINELPANLDELPQLCVLDIQSAKIKCLPNSITKLSKLRLLLLPYLFILETLPYDLKESLVIGVPRTHFRKTWKELKKEMEISSFPTITVDPTGYLRLTGDPRTWNLDNYVSHSKVRILDLELLGSCAKNITGYIAKLAELTHLYISSGYLSQLPLTFTRIIHISLYECSFECDLESFFDSLGKLSTLKSFHLVDSCEKHLPEHIDLPVSLTHLTLSYWGPFGHLSNSMAKLSNLQSLHLSSINNIDSFPENLNPKILKLVDCDLTNIKSLPGGLRHVEILHAQGNCMCNSYSFGICLNQLVAVETLSVTCYYIRSLPSFPGLHKLQELQLKDCFSIKELPPNSEVMKNLRTLNLSGTRIKSLPCSIWKLPKLQCLILPKCFQCESVPLEFRELPIFTIDDTDDKYYKNMGYHNFGRETSNAVNDDTTNTMKGSKEVVSKESEEGIISQQEISPQYLLNQPHATLILGDSHGSQGNYPIGQNSHHTICNYQNPESRDCTADNRLLNLQKTCIPSSQHALQPEQMASTTLEIDDGLPPIIQHDFSFVTANNLLVSENGQNEDYLHTEGDHAEGQKKGKEITQEAVEDLMFRNITLDAVANVPEDYNFDGRGSYTLNVNSQHSVYHSRNQEETCHFGESSQPDLQNVQLPENTTSPPNFNSNGRNKLIGENSHHVVSHSQEMESLSPGACSEMIKELISNFQGTVSFGKNSQHVVQDGQMDITNSATEQEDISSSDKRNDSCSGNNLDALENKQIDKNSHSKGENRKRYKKIDFTREDIQRLIAKRMKLVDAAKELSASRSTLKRKLKEYGIRWPKSSNKRRNTELPSTSKISSQVNLVPVGNEYTMEGLDGGNQHILPNQESNQNHNAIDSLSINTTVETVEVPMMETQLHTDDHELAQEFPNGANPSRLSATVQESGSSCSFVVKATYKGDTVKFVSSSTTIGELKDKVADNLEIELGKFKIKYEDSDKEMLLMTKNKHLEDALNLSYSSGSKFVRLFIIDL